MKEEISILGCGWLGKPLAIELIKQGYTVNGSTTSKEKFEEFKTLGIHPYLISLEALDTNLTSFLSAEILIVALPSKNINGFKNLIEFVEKSSVKKVLFISSTSVYPINNETVTEESSLGSSPLIEIEQLFTNNTHFKTTIMRFAGLFGYSRKPGNFFLNGRIIPNPEGFVNMIHQDDCVSILSKIINKNIWGEIFNGCADTHPKRRDYYIKTKADLGNEAPVFDEVTPNAKYKKVANNKVKKLLNFKFKYGDLMAINYGTLDT